MILTLDKIRRSGGSIVVLDGKLRIEAPAGTLSDQDRQVLAQHREALLQLFTNTVVDPCESKEREAIQWLEALPQAEAEVVVAQACREWDEIVIQAEVVPNGLLLHCPTKEIAEAVEAGRTELEAILAGDDAEQVEFVDIDQWVQDNTILPVSCDRCGGLEQWQDCGGTWHCSKCDPPIQCQILRQKADRLRRQPTTRKLLLGVPGGEARDR